MRSSKSKKKSHKILQVETFPLPPTLSRMISIWELTIVDTHNDFLRCEAQLSIFREAARKLIGAINLAHPAQAELLHRLREALEKTQP